MYGGDHAGLEAFFILSEAVFIFTALLFTV
jgi:hypothetical protein